MENPDNTLCRKCDHGFARTLSACPACGASRRRRRSHHDSARAWRFKLDSISAYLGERKFYFIYIPLGIFLGALLRPLMMFLAEFSMPEGWRYARSMGTEPFSFAHFIEPFIAAGKTLARWTYEAIVGTLAWAYRSFRELVLTYPSAVTMALLGAGIGFFVAHRRHRRRKRSSR